MADTAQLKILVINYAKDVYTAYKISRNKIDFCERYTNEIKKHMEAKGAFDALDGKQIPKVKTTFRKICGTSDRKKIML